MAKRAYIIGGPRYGRTAIGQILYDLAFTDLNERYLARKHRAAIAQIRAWRKLPEIRKLRRQTVGQRRARRRKRGTR